VPDVATARERNTAVLTTIVFGYVLGLPAGCLVIYDMWCYPRRAYRISGHHKRRWIGWAIVLTLTGWGGLVIGALWLLSNARHDVVDVTDRQQRI
jgi:hypothetical protein